jgi:membrane peptidoglycan carboxypeptidase
MEARRVFEPAEAFLVTSALRGAVEHGTGRGLRDRGFYGDVAAKSGTTNDYRDGWFVGYTPSLVVSVWVGFDHGGRLELPGASVALPIFADFLMEAVGPHGRAGPWGSDGFDMPEGLETVAVDPATGLRGGWGCWGEPEIFLRGTAPRTTCSGIAGAAAPQSDLLPGRGAGVGDGDVRSWEPATGLRSELAGTDRRDLNSPIKTSASVRTLSASLGRDCRSYRWARPSRTRATEGVIPFPR